MSPVDCNCESVCLVHDVCRALARNTLACRYGGAAGAQYAHEAGFDAFMTGAAFARLLPIAAASNAAQAHTSPGNKVLSVSSCVMQNVLLGGALMH